MYHVCTIGSIDNNMKSIKHKTISLNNSLNNNIEILKLGNKNIQVFQNLNFNHQVINIDYITKGQTC